MLNCEIKWHTSPTAVSVENNETGEVPRPSCAGKVAQAPTRALRKAGPESHSTNPAFRKILKAIITLPR